jgi:Caspase domain
MKSQYLYSFFDQFFRLLSMALVVMFSSTTFAQFSNCTARDPSIRFSDGTELCMSNISFLTNPGFVEDKPNQTLIEPLRSYSNYSVSTTNDPQMCPFVQSTEFRVDIFEDTMKLTQSICSKRLRDAIKKRGQISDAFECKCNVILKSGYSPFTKNEFLAKTEQYSKQVVNGFKPLNDFKSQNFAFRETENKDEEKKNKIKPNSIPEDQLQSPNLPILSSYTEKIALVIGNSNYLSQPLRNPINDSRAVAQKLDKTGFKVTYYQDLKANQIAFVMNDIAKKIKPGSVFAFYYAGHGYQIKDRNYFPAVDAKIRNEFDVPLQSLSLTAIMDLASDAKSELNLIILDACRNNPFIVATRGSAGLAKVEVPASGTMIFYATQPGKVAADGEGENGLFTENLLKHIDTPNLPIERFFKLVTNDVKKASSGTQVPWMEGSIDGEFTFN